MTEQASYRLIEADTPGEAWRKQMTLVLEDGATVHDGDVALHELVNVLTIVERPAESDLFVKRFGDAEMVEFMRRNFHTVEEIPEFGYSYGRRMQDFDGVDQLARVIAVLKEKPDSKSATITLGWPGCDERHHPCINVLDFKRRDGRIQMSCFFRSQDVGKKLYADVIALGELLQEVAEQVGCPAGRLLIFCASSHIYQTDEVRVREILATDA